MNDLEFDNLGIENKEDSDSEFDVDNFEVLKLQNRMKSANEQLEDLRSSQLNEKEEAGVRAKGIMKEEISGSKEP